jgi:hypothetical protein
MSGLDPVHAFRQPAAGRVDAVLHPRRRHQPGRHHQRRRLGVERDALLALQPHRQPGRRPLLAAEQRESARAADRGCERAALELQLTTGRDRGQRGRGDLEIVVPCLDQRDEARVTQAQASQQEQKSDRIDRFRMGYLAVRAARDQSRCGLGACPSRPFRPSVLA